jgi:hypothetical protein
MKGFCPSSVPLILSAKTGAGQNGTKSPKGDFCPPILSGNPTFGVFNFVRVLSGILSGRELGLVCPAIPFYSVTTDRRIG